MPHTAHQARLDYHRTYRANNREKRREYNRKYYAADPIKAAARARVTYAKWKTGLRERIFGEVLTAYCVCCGETNKDFLTIDHVHNDGAKERKELRTGGGIRIGYKLLRKALDKTRYQSLCYNCNCGRQNSPVKGVCPHKLAASMAA